MRRTLIWKENENHRRRAIFINMGKCPNITDWKSQVVGHYVELYLHVHTQKDTPKGIQQNVKGGYF